MRSWFDIGFVYMLAAVVVLSACLTSCNGSTSDHKTPDFKVVRSIRGEYAKGFSIEVLSDSSRLITLFNLDVPGQILQTIRWVPKPIQRVGCLSTTHIAYLDALGRLENVGGCGFANRLMNPEAAERFRRGTLVNLTTGNELDAEAVFGVMPELLFVYPFGGSGYEKFLQKGIGCVQISEYLEKHPLGRAEWLKVFGVLLGEEDRASLLFKQIRDNYLALRDSVARASGLKPVVFTASMDGDQWAVPSANSFTAHLIEDAGGAYLFRDTSATGNLVLTFESFFNAAAKADFWGKIIYADSVQSLDQFTQGDQRLMVLPAFQKKQLFYCNAMLTDYHGIALLQPDELLRDMVHIIHPMGDSAAQGNKYFKPWTVFN